MATMHPKAADGLQGADLVLWKGLAALDDAHMVFLDRTIGVTAPRRVWGVVANPSRGILLLIPEEQLADTGDLLTAVGEIVSIPSVAMHIVDPNNVPANLVAVVDRHLPPWSAPNWFLQFVRALRRPADGYPSERASAPFPQSVTPLGPTNRPLPVSERPGPIAGVAFYGPSQQVAADLQDGDDGMDHELEMLRRSRRLPSISRSVKVRRTRLVNTDPDVLRCRDVLRRLLVETFAKPADAAKAVERMAVRPRDEDGPRRAATILANNPGRFGTIASIPGSSAATDEVESCLADLRAALGVAMERAVRIVPVDD